MNNLMLHLSIIYSFIIVKVYCYIELEIDTRDLFPYPANKLFLINIVRKDRGGSVSDHIANTMVIVIRDNDTSRSILDKVIFDYGFKESIDQPYKSDYMKILSWLKDSVGDSININILFFRSSNNKILEVYQLPAQNMNDRKKMLIRFDGSKVLLQDQIKLLVPPRIELTILSLDGRKNELMLQENATATCRSFDGMPPMEPMFHGLSELDVKNFSRNFDRNEAKVQFLVSLFDHEKKLRCTAGSTEATGIILVMHHPSQVTLDPEPGSSIENGSTVACLKADGYPTPIVRWSFINGPANASRYFVITDGGANFTLSKDAPLRSHWTLNCTAFNVIPGSKISYHRTVTFTVGRLLGDGLFATLDLTRQLILGAVVFGAVLMFCLIICMVRKCCVSDSSTGTTRKNGLPNKAASKEKGLEAEQVILLPPGSPPNYIDLSNSGAGLPPPPPEYELMLPEESKHPAPIDKRVVNDSYNEVMYAELNTSNLPMKGPHLSTGSSCSNDDQVIYSQIVGTVSNAYGPPRPYLDSNNV